MGILHISYRIYLDINGRLDINKSSSVVQVSYITPIGCSLACIVAKVYCIDMLIGFLIVAYRK